MLHRILLRKLFTIYVHNPSKCYYISQIANDVTTSPAKVPMHIFIISRVGYISDSIRIYPYLRFFLLATLLALAANHIMAPMISPTIVVMIPSNPKPKISISILKRHIVVFEVLFSNLSRWCFWCCCRSFHCCRLSFS